MNQARVKKLIICIPLIVLYFYVPAQKVSEFEICAEVVDREPQDTREAFSLDESAWAWMRLVEGTVGDSISVEWYAADELVHTHKLVVKYESMRTYATKKLSQTGTWGVLIKNSAGETIKEGSFQVGEKEAQ